MMSEAVPISLPQDFRLNPTLDPSPGATKRSWTRRPFVRSTALKAGTAGAHNPHPSPAEHCCIISDMRTVRKLCASSEQRPCTCRPV